MNKKVKRVTAVLALAAFVFVAVFGAVGLAISSHHACTGMHCHTCVCIAAMEQTVRVIKAALLLVFALWVARRGIACFSAKQPPAFEHCTAVGLKTKLNN